MRYAMLILILLLVGCSTLQVQSPITTKPATLDLSAGKQAIIEALDLACNDTQFNTGLYDGYFLNRKDETLTVQQKNDLSALQAFCATPKEQRTDYNYGFQAGRIANTFVSSMIPLLGRDAIAALRGVSLIP